MSERRKRRPTVKRKKDCSNKPEIQRIGSGNAFLRESVALALAKSVRIR